MKHKINSRETQNIAILEIRKMNLKNPTATLNENLVTSQSNRQELF